MVDVEFVAFSHFFSHTHNVRRRRFIVQTFLIHIAAKGYRVVDGTNSVGTLAYKYEMGEEAKQINSSQLTPHFLKTSLSHAAAALLHLIIECES